jgi:hypothetical protein
MYWEVVGFEGLEHDTDLCFAAVSQRGGKAK